MPAADTLQSIIDVLGSNQGTIGMAVAAAVGIGSPVVDRLVIRRRRIQYQVLYNSRIGLSPVFLEPDGDRSSPPALANPELNRLARQLEKLSVLIIRIRNTGSTDIDESDIEPPLSVTFGNRIVWDARISEASDEQLRTHTRENLQFFTNTDGVRPTKKAATGPPEETEAIDEPRNLSALRRWLARRLADTLTPDEGAVGPPEPEPQWHGVRLAKLWMRRKQSFILVVVLHEAAETSEEISKQYRITGGHANGRTIIEKRKQGWLRWPIVTTAIGVVLVGALLGTVLAKVIIGGQRPTTISDVPCVPGTVSLAGSSAFGPIVQTLGDTYLSKCPGAHVSVDSSGSLDGVRLLLTQDPAKAATTAALSDGASDEAPPSLNKQLVAVIVYGLVINKKVGVDHLSADQLAGIYSGRYTNWSQSPLGGAALPIQIVGRGASSGTRQAFERDVLGGSEGELSSDNCQTKDRIANAPTIRCERDTTEQLVQAVSTVPGAIGYADLANQATKDAVRSGQIVPVTLDNRYPQVDSLPSYPFWTVEYLYTRGTPSISSPLGAFLAYLQSDSAQASLFSAGYTPCVSKNGAFNQLCAER